MKYNIKWVIFVVYKWHCIKSTKKKSVASQIVYALIWVEALQSRCICIERSTLFEQPWVCDLTCSSHMNIKRNKKKKKPYVNEKRMKKITAWFETKGRFFNSYSRSVCGTLFVFREIIFCCMWRHFIFNAFLFIFLLIQKAL